MKQKHVHKYMRVWVGRRKADGKHVYRCMLKDCRHFYTHRELLVGHSSICWRCGETFTLTMRNTQLKKPHCDRCTRHPYGSDVRVLPEVNIDNIFERLMQRKIG